MIVKTTNGGQYWIPNTGTIRKTTDGGTTWNTQTSTATGALYDVSFVNDQVGLIVGASGRILRTTNGGTNWSIISSGTPATLRELNFVNNLRAWVVGTNGTILNTTNAGLNWSQQYTTPSGVGTTLRGVSFKDLMNGWIVDYDGNILRTTDGGESWSIQYSRLGWAVRLTNLKFTAANRLTSIGRYGNIITSTNGGFNWLRQTYNLPEQYLHNSNNIVATIPGSLFPEKECIIVAHYDSYSTINPMNTAPGANDNGTGTAAVIEAARLCAGLKFENTVRFLAVSAEELGMIGYPTTADTSRLVIGSYQTYNRLIDSAITFNQRYGIGLTLVPVIDNTGASDYGPFALAGYDALDVAEATAEEIWGGADPYYHTVNDTYDKLRPGLIKKGTQLMLATVTELAKPIGPTNIKDIASDELRFSLNQNYPNPFNPSTEIPYTLANDSYVRLSVYNILGEKVATIFEGRQDAGSYKQNWSPNLSSGIYFYRLEATSTSNSFKIE
ncbi:MAG: M28 family peptidase [Bacteroidota bacterium]|nr:M28 family peptidase [Bacteroidota bacterium]